MKRTVATGTGLVMLLPETFWRVTAVLGLAGLPDDFRAWMSVIDGNLTFIPFFLGIILITWTWWPWIRKRFTDVIGKYMRSTVEDDSQPLASASGGIDFSNNSGAITVNGDVGHKLTQQIFVNGSPRLNAELKAELLRRVPHNTHISVRAYGERYALFASELQNFFMSEGYTVSYASFGVINPPPQTPTGFYASPGKWEIVLNGYA